jgi:murein DD-endopeptidase MepM/ murein hydrolase activator NlpD
VTFVSLNSRFLFLLVLHVVFLNDARAAEVIALSLPIRCELGVTCFVQNYVDHDPSDRVRDYQCGSRTYDGHSGTDIRIPSLEIQRGGVEVLASAAGTVAGIRDGVDDVSVRVSGRLAVEGKECGNGAVIEHEDGWRTQYCHLAKGSLRVKSGDRVTTGQPIGMVGLSGNTEFPHLHFAVLHGGKTVDPFAHEAPPNSCGGGHSIWSKSIREQINYRAREVINYGFSGLLPTMDLVESGQVLKETVNSESEALVAYVRVIGIEEGDRQILTVLDPAGAVIAEYKAPPLERDKAQYLVSSGRKRKGTAWPQGTYEATYRITRNDTEVLRKSFKVQLGPK